MKFKGNNVLGKIIEERRISKIQELMYKKEENYNEIFTRLSKLSRQSRKDFIIKYLLNDYKLSEKTIDYIASMSFDERLEYMSLPRIQSTYFEKIISGLTEKQLEEILDIADLSQENIGIILKRMPEKQRIKHIERLGLDEKRKILLSLSEENRRLVYENIDANELKQIIESTSGEEKLRLAIDLKDTDKKIGYILQIETLDNYTDLLIKNLSKDEIKTVLRESNKFDSKNARTLMEYISGELTADEKIDLLYKFNSEGSKPEEGLESVDGKLKYFLDIKSGSTNLDIRILKDIYTSIFSQEQMRRIICFKDIQEELIKLNDQELFTLSKTFKDRITTNGETRWENYLEEFIDRKDDFKQLINAIYENQDSEIDYNLIRRVMQTNNLFDIQSVEELKDIKRIKQAKCDELIKSDSITDKKLAIFEKRYGHNLEFAQELIEKYGNDLLSFTNEKLRDYLIDLKRIIDTNDIEELNRIYASSENVQIADMEEIENSIVREFEKEFNQAIKQKGDAKQYFDENGNAIEGFYDAGTDFTMLVRAYGATHNTGLWIKDYYEYSVGADKVKTSIQQSCSLIRWDMLGNASFTENKVNELPVVFGYNDVKQGSLLDCCNGDSSVTTGERFSLGRRAGAANETSYFFSDGLINHTFGSYNEVNTKRRKPDYIVAFMDKNGEIANIENIKKARADFLKHGIDISVKVIDMEACRKRAIEDFQQNIEDYKQNPSCELGNLIYLKSIRHWGELKDYLPKEMIEDILKKHREFEEQRKNIEYIAQKSREQDEISSGTGKSKLLESAVKATEGVTRIGIINEQVRIIKKEEREQTGKEGQVETIEQE